MSPQEQTMDEMADLAVRLFKIGVTLTVEALTECQQTKDEILLEIKTNYWEMFNVMRDAEDDKAEDIFAREYNCELCERLQVADYTYKDDEDAYELLNIWAYHEAKKQMEN